MSDNKKKMQTMKQEITHLNATVFSLHKTIFEPWQLKFKIEKDV